MRYIRFSLVLLMALAALAVPASAGDYLVAPAGEEDISGALPLDVSEVSLLELPLWILLIEIFCIPGEIISALKYSFLISVQRISRNDLLDNPSRKRVYNCILENPGQGLYDIMRVTGINKGTLRYHLKTMLKSSLLSVNDETGRISYFVNNASYSECQKRFFMYIRNENARRILEVISENPYITRKEVARRVGLTGASVTWHIKNFEEDNIIISKKMGRSVHYLLNQNNSGYLRANHFTQENAVSV